ncbi:MAG: hypothetical protein ACKVZH_03715 [Blastocatellia bacterium]
MNEYDNSPEDQSPNDRPSKKSGWSLFRVLLVAVPTAIPVVYFYLSGKEHWSVKDLAIVGGMFVGYWVMVLFVAARVMRHRHAQAITLASPLIELPLNAEIRQRLSSFADDQQQKLAVVAFDLLDREIPRFEQDDERDRARRDNEHLRQQAGQGTFLVAVTTEILKRLLLLSGAQEDDRKVWRDHISETAARIISNALDHRLTVAEQV